MADSSVGWVDENPAAPAAPANDGWVDESSLHGDQSAPDPALSDPRVVFGNQTKDVLSRVGGRIIDNVKALPAALNPVPQTSTERGMAAIGLPAPVTRMVGGILDALGVTGNIQGGGAGPGGIPGAVSDIMASPDRNQVIQNSLADAGGDALTQAGLMKLGDVAGEVDPKAALKAGVDTGVEAVKAALPKSVKEVIKVGERYAANKAANAAVSEGAKVAPSANSAPPDTAGPVITDPDAIQAKLREILGKQKPEPKGKAPAVDAEAMKSRLASLENPTDAATLKSRFDELENPPATAQEIRDRLDDISNPTDAAVLKSRLKELEAAEPPKSAPVGSKVGAAEDTAFFQRAKAILPEDTPLSKVASKAQALKEQSSDFEKVFGKPLSTYQDAEGNFDMGDFLTEVVKPGTHPVPDTISRQFGSEGVKLLHDVSGKPLHKWADEKMIPPSQTYLDGMAKQDASMNAPASGGAPQGPAFDAFDRVVGKNVENISPKTIQKAWRLAEGHVTAKPSLLGIGNESTVLDLGDHVAKIGNKGGDTMPVPKHPDILQPSRDMVVDGHRVQVMPKVKTGDVTPAEITGIVQRLHKAGYTRLDIAEGNFGRTAQGKPVVIDTGGLQKIRK
jgi:hypothetical protein